jgi:hypothetical protein
VTSVAVCLLELTIAASVAALLVGLLRTPVRGIAGARAAYGLWLMVPLSTLTVLLPTPPHPLAPMEMVPALTCPPASLCPLPRKPVAAAERNLPCALSCNPPGPMQPRRYPSR